MTVLSPNITVTATQWSPLLGSPGQIVTGNDDIGQCVGIIVTTPKGSDPLRPLFGCDAWLYLDQPLAVAVPGIVLAVTDALELWEQRIQVTSVTAVLSASGAVVTVNWQLAGGSAENSTEVPIGNPTA